MSVFCERRVPSLFWPLPPYPLLGGKVIASERPHFTRSPKPVSVPGVAAKLLRMRRLAILSHTLRGGISRVQLLALHAYRATKPHL